MSVRAKKNISRGLIAAGVLLIVFVVCFEAMHYPWRALFAEVGLMGPETLQSLPDPAPLPERLLEMEPDSQEQEVNGLMDDPDVTLLRPQVALESLGIIKIPAISVSANIVSGTGNELYYGIGHVPSSALPGQEGNCVLAGHRNHILAAIFRHLDKLKAGDSIHITYAGVPYEYVVYKTFVVEPTESWVMQLQEGESHMVTLITCTPHLNPTHRLIVWGRLVAK